MRIPLATKELYLLPPNFQLHPSPTRNLPDALSGVLAALSPSSHCQISGKVAHRSAAEAIWPSFVSLSCSRVFQEARAQDFSGEIREH